MDQLTIKQIKGVKNLIFLKSLVIGFFGGIIWSTFLVILHVFKVVEVNPMIVLKIGFGDKPWLARWYAYVLLIIVLGLISMIVAIAYYFIFKKLKSWLIGGAYGVLIWGLLIVCLPLIINGFSQLNSYTSQTYIATLCVMLLYGIFIGYSISFEYNYAIEECRKR